MAFDPRDLLTGAEWLVAGSALMTTVWLGVKKMYRVAKNVDETLDLMNKINTTLSPNGGGSMYDAVTRIHQKQDEFQGQIDEINTRLKRVEKYHLKPRKVGRRGK